MPADDARRDEPVDRAVAVDHEVRADAGLLAEVRCVRGERRVRGGERVGRCVVLHDHVRVHEPPAVDAVVALRVRARLGEPGRPERDRLHDDARAWRVRRRCSRPPARTNTADCDRRRDASQIAAAVHVLRPKRIARGLNAATNRIFARVACRSSLRGGGEVVARRWTGPACRVAESRCGSRRRRGSSGVGPSRAARRPASPPRAACRSGRRRSSACRRFVTAFFMRLLASLPLIRQWKPASRTLADAVTLGGRPAQDVFDREDRGSERGASAACVRRASSRASPEPLRALPRPRGRRAAATAAASHRRRGLVGGRRSRLGAVTTGAARVASSASAKASARPPAVAYRPSGSFASAFASTSSRAGGRSARSSTRAARLRDVRVEHRVLGVADVRRRGRRGSGRGRSRASRRRRGRRPAGPRSARARVVDGAEERAGLRQALRVAPPREAEVAEERVLVRLRRAGRSPA